MTGQIHDRILYQGREYSLVGVNGTGLYNPADTGMQTMMLHTACYRGFYCVYPVVADGGFRWNGRT